MALTGRLDVDFVHDPIAGADGCRAVGSRRPIADELPDAGFDPGKSGFVAPAADGSTVEVVVEPGSERLELLEPFPAWDGRDYAGLRVLMKAAGKCTTDHISPAGPWLRYRGHLTNISGNLFNGVNNAFSPDEPGTGVDVRDGSVRPLPELAKAYKDAGIAWVAVGDENYGEGSSREHAAMEPRYMGGKVDARALVRAHPRGEPEEAGRARADVQGSRRLRQGPRSTTRSTWSGSPTSRRGCPSRWSSTTPTGRRRASTRRTHVRASTSRGSAPVRALNVLRSVVDA